MRNMMSVPIERLRELFQYDPQTGLIRRRISVCGIDAGSVAGSRDSLGYLRISVDGKRLQAHRIAFALHYGRWPRYEIDHINGVKGDNRILNLREATTSQNQMNKSGWRAGLKGAYQHQQSRRWMARIQKNGRVFHLGYFDTEAEAHAAYAKAACDLFGDFARLQ